MGVRLNCFNMAAHRKYSHSPYYGIVLKSQRFLTSKPHLKWINTQRLLLTHKGSVRAHSKKRAKFDLSRPNGPNDQKLRLRRRARDNYIQIQHVTYSSKPSKVFVTNPIKLLLKVSYSLGSKVTNVQDCFRLLFRTGHLFHSTK